MNHLLTTGLNAENTPTTYGSTEKDRAADRQRYRWTRCRLSYALLSVVVPISRHQEMATATEHLRRSEFTEVSHAPQWHQRGHAVFGSNRKGHHSTDFKSVLHHACSQELTQPVIAITDLVKASFSPELAQDWAVPVAIALPGSCLVLFVVVLRPGNI